MILRPHREDHDRYARQRLFAPLGADGDARLRKSTALVVGCGALGSRVAFLLARAGVGTLRLVDRDVVDWTNLHRQEGYTEEDARASAPKSVALARRLAEVSSAVTVEPVISDFNFRNARELGAGALVLVDGSDNLPTRFLLNDLSLALDVPWIYGGAVGEEARAQAFVPGHGPCLRCLLPELPAPGSLPTCDTAGIIAPAAAAAAAFQAALALRCLARPESRSSVAGILVRMTVWTPAATTSRVDPDPACTACRGGELEFLAGRRREQTTLLCGRSSIQVLPDTPVPEEALDLAALAGRLGGAGEVELTPYLLRFSPAGAGQRLTVFKDRRAIVEGTRDGAIARALYDRYVGR